jgi:hypothetical protein
MSFILAITEEKGKIRGAPPFGRGLIHQTQEMNRMCGLDKSSPYN